MKPKLIFSPIAYIATLKHFERLVPYLKDKYNIGFLFIGSDTVRGREAIEYCKKKNYEFHVINKGLTKDQRIRIPFVTPFYERYIHSVACRDFLERVMPAKIIAAKSTPMHDTILKEANRKGIETIALQWASPVIRFSSLTKSHERKHTWIRRIYLYLLKIFSSILDIFYKESRFGLTSAIPKKVGVFDEDEKQNGMGKRYDPNTVHVVGPPDIQLVHELKQKIGSSLSFKKQLLGKYDLNENKLKIIVFLFRFYRVPDYKRDRSQRIMTISEYIILHSKLIKAVRSVFPVEEADIMLKMHPSESSEKKDMKSIYETYRDDFGVKIYDGSGEARTEELVSLSDLCISIPPTSANYVILGTDIPAIFINLSEFKTVNNVAPHFGIKHVVGNTDEFADLLKQFKNGTLPKQYDNSNANFKSVDSVIKLIG